MAFNYQSAGPAGQTPLSPTSKDVQCKSFKIDFSAANATTAVPIDIGWLPKDAQIVLGYITVTTATSGPSVTAATIAVSIGGSLLFNNLSVFATSGGFLPNSSGYFGTLPTSTDQKISITPTLTGGTTATAGIFYIQLFYVI